MARVVIKRFDPELPLPAYQTKGAAAMDLYAREDTLIFPHEIGYVPLNVALEIPEDYWVLLASRSSTHKMGLMPANGIGIMDWDFRGDNDEYVFPLYNFRDAAVTVEKGTRIAQLLLVKHESIEITEVAKLENEDRGKFGSTGTKVHK